MSGLQPKKTERKIRKHSNNLKNMAQTVPFLEDSHEIIITVIIKNR